MQNVCPPDDPPPKVHVVDDDADVRGALQFALQREGLAVAAYGSAEAFLAADLAPFRGCAIVDMHMPGMNGLQVQEALSVKGIPLPVIILTGHSEVALSVSAIKSGAEDYLLKPISHEKLMLAVYAALAKNQRLWKKAEQRRLAAQRLAQLTYREREIMLLAISGCTDKEAARRLNISHRTVEKHKSSVLQKTGSKNVLDLYALALECGLILP